MGTYLWLSWLALIFGNSDLFEETMKLANDGGNLGGEVARIHFRMLRKATCRCKIGVISSARRQREECVSKECFQGIKNAAALANQNYARHIWIFEGIHKEMVCSLWCAIELYGKCGVGLKDKRGKQIRLFTFPIYTVGYTTKFQMLSGQQARSSHTAFPFESELFHSIIIRGNYDGNQ